MGGLQPIKDQPIDYKEKFELQSINVASRSYRDKLIDIDLQAIVQEIENIVPFTPIPIESYLVYTAVLSQSGGDNPKTIGEGIPLVAGVRYEFGPTAIDGSWDFSNVGGPMYPKTHAFTATASDIPNSWTGVSFLSYNEGDPVVTVLENNLGDIYWTYDSTGFYTGHSGGAFTENKSFALISSSTMGAIVTNISVYDNSNVLIVASDSEGYRENFIAYVEIRVYLDRRIPPGDIATDSGDIATY